MPARCPDDPDDTTLNRPIPRFSPRVPILTYAIRMMRRSTFLSTLAAASQVRSLLAQASPAKTGTATMRLSMPPFGLTDAGFNFVKQLGVQWITMGGPGRPRILQKDES